MVAEQKIRNVKILVDAPEKSQLNEHIVHVLAPQSTARSVIDEIANSGCEEAFYVCDINEIVRQQDTWRTFLPRVMPYYAVKANDSKIVLEVLAALGTGFDCASEEEIKQVLALGVVPDRIIFANPIKPSGHIRYANKTGVEKMTFDTSHELHKMKQFHPLAKVVIRLRCDARVAQCPLGKKFGCDAVTEAPQLLQLARSLGIDVVGVCFHVGSGCQEAGSFKRAIASARDVFDAAAALGYNFTLLDIGGGFPGKHGTSIREIAEVVNAALDEYFPDLSEIQVISEPGCFHVTSAYTLTCNVHSIREEKDHFMYYIDDGLYGSFALILRRNEQVEGIPLNGSGGLYSSSIWGQTMDGNDRVVEEARLPKMKIGDWIMFEDMGAYTLTLAGNFNGFPKPKVYAVADMNTWMLLKNKFPLSEHFDVFAKF